MSHRSIAALAVSAVIVLGGCSSGGGSAAAGGSCKETTDAGVVAVSIVDYAFQPADVTAKTGQVIAFTNTGQAPHTATVDGGCTTPTIQPGKADGLTFSVAGTYKFHCSIHSSMTGTIVIS